MQIQSRFETTSQPRGETCLGRSNRRQNSDELEEEPRRKKRRQPAASDQELEHLYDVSSARILQGRNDFFLPQIQDFVADKKWVNLRPEYQRRLRWDKKKQSRLIESLLMNVPVPPIFLYERELNRYEAGMANSDLYL
jgi:hypothetical protein